HRIATESSLHLADVICYVTDYNHVLSQMNFTFLKQLQQQGKEILLIVNQIDKHAEEELSFTVYKNAIATAFAIQQIDVTKIYYTTLKSQDTGFNQTDALIAHLQHYMNDSAAHVSQHAATAAEQLINEHMMVYNARHQQEREQLEQSLEDIT